MPELDLTAEAQRLKALLRAWIPDGVSWLIVLESDDMIEAVGSWESKHGYVTSLVELMAEQQREAEDGD